MSLWSQNCSSRIKGGNSSHVYTLQVTLEAKATHAHGKGNKCVKLNQNLCMHVRVSVCTHNVSCFVTSIHSDRKYINMSPYPTKWGVGVCGGGWGSYKFILVQPRSLPHPIPNICQKQLPGLSGIPEEGVPAR